MRIGLDMDGVLADFDRGWVERYNEDFGADLHPKQNDHWDALLTITHFEHYNDWWDWARSHHEDLFLGLDPLPGAVEGATTLAERGHEICIITSKPRWAAGHPSNWLMEHGIHYDEIHVTSKKHLVKCDLYIDDALHNVVDLMKYTEARVIQYSAWPYVNNGERVPGAFYAQSWDEIIEGVDEWQKSLDSPATVASGKMKLQKSLFSRGLLV